MINISELQRKQYHSNVFRLNHETLLELQYYDVTKSEDEYDFYIYHGLKGIFNVALVISPDKKIQKRFKNGTMRSIDWDNAKGFDLANLILVKEKLNELKKELREDEVFYIEGHDIRRFKIYNRFLSKDQRFAHCISGFDNYLFIHRDWHHKGIYNRNIYDDTNSYFYRVGVYSYMRKENLPPEDYTSITWGNYSQKREKERRKEIKNW